MQLNTNYIDRILSVTLSPLLFVEFYEEDLFINRKDAVRKLYPLINREFSIYNLDEVNLIFEKAYPESKTDKAGDSSRYYINLLENFANSFLTHRDGEITFKYWESEKDYFESYKNVEKVLLWSSLNRMIPTDILIPCFLIKNKLCEIKNLNGVFPNLQLGDKQLDSILKKGISETHLHASASIDFYVAWSIMMSCENNTFIHLKNQVLGVNTNLEKHLEVAKIIRILLAKYVEEYKVSKVKFKEFLKKLNEEIGGDLIREFLSLKVENEELKKEKLQELFRKLKEWVYEKAEKSYEETTGQLDILALIYPDSLDTSFEMIYLMQALHYIRANGNSDFSKLFFKYLKTKNATFRTMVQGNKIKGLDNFVEYFSRSTKINSVSEAEMWKEKMKYQFKDKNLKKVEFRISPKKSELEMYKELQMIFKEYKNQLLKYKEQHKYYDYPLIGIVYHFIKEKDSSKKCWYEYEKGNQGEESYISYKEKHTKYRAEMENIVKMRREIPNISKYIVGVDCASLENNTDPWVFSTIYEEIRDSKNGYRDSEGNRMQSLGFSFHAGEDFRHIISGIRRVDEAVTYFKYHSGDRIGHGIALGVDIKEWCKHHSVVILPRIEHLENMLWIWGKMKYSFMGIEVTYLERRIFDIVKDIYGNIEGITIYSLWEMYVNKFKKMNSFEMNLDNYTGNCCIDGKNIDYRQIFCFTSQNREKIYERSWNVKKLQMSYHCEKYASKMKEPIQVRIDEEEIALYQELQRNVLKDIVKEGVIVETNPTSNLAIGEVKSIFEHYIKNLNQLRDAEVEDSNYKYLMATINSDDPSVFNTTLSNEFAYIYYSLVNEGYPKELILNWMDKIREYGMNTSFIADRNESIEFVIEEVEYILKKLAEQIK